MGDVLRGVSEWDGELQESIRVVLKVTWTLNIMVGGPTRPNVAIVPAFSGTAG